MNGMYKDPKKMKLFEPAYTGKYVRNIDIIRKYHRRVWETQQHTLFTDHGIKHSNKIIWKINNWLKDKSFKNLKTYTNESAEASAFILLSAIYLHDIGMQCTKEHFKHFYPDDTAVEDMEDGDLEFLEKVRGKHHLLSKAIILESIEYGKSNDASRFFKLETYQDVQLEMRAVSLLCASHCDPIPSGINDEIKKNYPLSEESVNLRRLMYILRVGDALDADFDRINKDKLNQGDLWSELEKHPKYYSHIFKHFVVDYIDTKTFEFQYSLPSTHPKLNDEIFQEDCMEFTEAALRKNHKMYSNHMHKLDINFPEISHSIWKGRSSKESFLKKIPDQAIEWLHREAKRLRTDQISDCLSIAKEMLFIAGQNLFFISNPSRYTDGDLKEELFYELFLNKLKEKKEKEDKHFKIRILILNPQATIFVEEWHNKLIENWEKTPEHERSKEHQKTQPDFKDDLCQSFNTFKIWQKDIQEEFSYLKWTSSSMDLHPEAYPFIVKCVSERIDSANIIDPEKRDPRRNESIVNITHKWAKAIPDARGRRKIIYDKVDNKDEVLERWDHYKKLFADAKYILDVNFNTF